MVQTTITKAYITSLYEHALFELIYQAYKCHSKNFKRGDMEFCALCSIKTGACPEDCAYCPQSAHYKTNLKKEKLLNLEQVLIQARRAQRNGAKRFCIGAAWRNPPKKDFPKVLNIIKSVKELGLEVCATLGMLDKDQVTALAAVGLDYYNHNLDTSSNYYPSIITTRSYQDRIDTLTSIGESCINVCCGGILGMGETRDDRIEFLLALASLPSAPQSIPINKLIAIPGTPLAKQQEIDSFEFIKSIAVTRILFPYAKIRLSAGRENMSDEMQAWCFMAGANSIFIGEKLLTAKNSDTNRDVKLMQRLGLSIPKLSEQIQHAE